MAVAESIVNKVTNLKDRLPRPRTNLLTSPIPFALRGLAAVGLVTLLTSSFVAPRVANWEFKPADTADTSATPSVDFPAREDRKEADKQVQVRLDRLISLRVKNPLTGEEKPVAQYLTQSESMPKALETPGRLIHFAGNEGGYTHYLYRRVEVSGTDRKKYLAVGPIPDLYLGVDPNYGSYKTEALSGDDVLTKFSPLDDNSIPNVATPDANNKHIVMQKGTTAPGIVTLFFADKNLGLKTQTVVTKPEKNQFSVFPTAIAIEGAFNLDSEMIVSPANPPSLFRQFGEKRTDALLAYSLEDVAIPVKSPLRW